MTRVKMNNLGIPPLAGVCSYEEACKVGIDVDRNVSLLRRYLYIQTQLNKIFAAHLASTPEWEVKCAFSLHMWLAAEHSAILRKRVTEMREPPLHLDKVPDLQLEKLFQELIRSDGTSELVVGIYGVVMTEFVAALKLHLDETNPLVDHPTYRILKIIRMEQEEMLAWGKQAIVGLTPSSEIQLKTQKWADHLAVFLDNAGGISGEANKIILDNKVAPRNDGQPYEMQMEPKRDERFIDIYNDSVKIDSFYGDADLEPDERTYALLYKRLREMDVPEWMGPIIYRTNGKPWDYYVDMSRQLWDEARHSMLGEVGLYQDGVEFYKYPIEYKTSMTLNKAFTALEAHTILWYIEQSLMPKETGKRYEWVVAMESDNALAKTFQDYDWADEVLHAQIGRKWLVPEHGSLEEMKNQGALISQRYSIERAKLDVHSEQLVNWWPQFLAEIREGRDKIRGKQLQPK
ncbi:hypothetical protein EHS13_05540 [Paenibacillus psychroresistens]|uniref:Uncharacterized protein n=1 Tax=Paenibacillus psychroresistens TaxID=1778678 RepID=A0A6B8RFB1_9BACL|nr:hypothetical protein [Paenibacillus psychroresistens]QGQ94404.1 hypothetical protein EHS13_05540 [Paenibacillus psychroresistens]